MASGAFHLSEITVFRMDEFVALVHVGNWALELPFHVRGIPIDEETLAPRQPTVPSLAELAKVNPNLEGQLRVWRAARRGNGEDPFDYTAFREHLRAIGAPDPGEVEFLEFCPADVRPLRAANAFFGAQLAAWQRLRRERGEDPFDYAALREHLRALGSPDPGPDEFQGFRD